MKIFTIGAIALVVIIFAIVAIREAMTESFYHNPIKKRCRYFFKKKWLKGEVEWNNGDYYYITPDERKQAYDLVHRRDVKPIYIKKLW